MQRGSSPFIIISQTANCTHISNTVLAAVSRVQLTSQAVVLPGDWTCDLRSLHTSQLSVLETHAQTWPFFFMATLCCDEL